MSVIWSGVTEEGAVVPVQVTDEGKVVAVGDGPEGDYLKLTGGNLTGDLTVNEQITLATDGSASFAGDVNVDSPSRLFVGTSSWSGDYTGQVIQGNSTANEGPGVIYLSRGSVSVKSGQYLGEFNFSDRDGDKGASIVATGDGVWATDDYPGRLVFSTTAAGGSSPRERMRIDSSGDVFIGDTLLNPNGSATFAGDVVIGSRGSRWLIRESNGVAMLVEQTLRQPREEVKVRDLPNELDLIEQALSEVMEKLRMVPPAGWGVWNGSDDP